MVADGIEVVDQLTKIGDYHIISDHPGEFGGNHRYPRLWKRKAED